MTTVAKNSVPSRAERAVQTRQRILAVAVRLFRERGYAGTSLQDIAAEMGLTKAAIFYHYRAKDGILVALSEPAFRAAEGIVDRVASLKGKRARLDAAIDGFTDLILEHRDVIALMSREPAMRIDVHALRGREDDFRIRALRVLYGEAPTPDQRLAVFTATAIADSLFVIDDLPDDQLRDVLSRTLRRLIVAP